MMILLFNTPPVLTPGWTHEATDWQVAKDPDFEHVVKQSLGDKTNKLVKIFDDTDLDPETTYYARSRIVFNKGLSEWSNVDVIRIKDKKPIEIMADVPTTIAVPEITLDFNTGKCPATFFRIMTSKMNSTVKADHIATDLIIEDEYGNVVYSKLDDSQSLTNFLITDVLLEEGKLYFIKVQYRASSGDVSNVGKLPIFVPKQPFKILTNLKDIYLDEDLVINISPVSNFKSLSWRLYAVGLDTRKQLASGSSNTLSFVIPKSKFTNPEQLYIVEIYVTLKDDKKLGPKYGFIAGKIYDEGVM
jgi:hypothetical protein